MNTSRTESQLVLPHTSVKALLESVRHYAVHGVETGAFLLSHPDESELAIVALTGAAGISRSPYQFRVSGAALNRLFDWASESSLQIRAQVHSHRGDAFLSPTDLEFGLSVEGFTTCVVPWFSRPPSRPDRWGWWQYAGTEWSVVAAPRASDGAVTIVYFDELGVHG